MNPIYIIPACALGIVVLLAVVILGTQHLKRTRRDPGLPPEIKRPLMWRSIPLHVDFWFVMVWLSYLAITDQFDRTPASMVFLGIFGTMAALRGLYLYVLVLINGDRLSALPRGWVWTPSGNLAGLCRGKCIIVEQIRTGTDAGRWAFSVNARESDMTYPSAEAAVVASMEGVAS